MKKILPSLLCSCLLCLGANAQSLKLSGNDLIAPIIESSVKDLAKNNNVDVEIAMKGTYSAFDELLSGASDVAIVSIPKGRTPPEGITILPFAYQVAIVIANNINPLEEISTKQLKNIFSNDAATRVESWAQLGVKTVGMRNVMPIVVNDVNNVVVELFKYAAMNGMNLGAWVNVSPSLNDLMNSVKANNPALGIVPKVTDPKAVKIISVSDSAVKNSYAFKPDVDSIFNGDYPMTLPIYIAFKSSNIAKAKPLAKILLDDAVAKKIDASSFYSAPKNSRKKSLFELDISQ